MTSGVIVSDLHLGDYAYGKTDPETGLNTRFLDFLQNLDQSIDFAIKHEVDFFFVVGDIYRSKHPNSKIRKQFAPRIKKLIQNKIGVMLMTGNHDMTTSADGAHSLSEMEELCELIPGLIVYSSPAVVEIGNTALFVLPFVNRGEQELMTVNDLLKYQIRIVKEYNQQSHKSKAKHNLFFGHFGTDKSVVGGSFDLDMSSDENENVVTLDSFDDGNWTAVYLGHIHKQQQLNKVVKHIGSIGRVDFAEEDETKGFYFYKDGHDEFVSINDRKFKTFHLKLDANHATTINEFLNKLQQLDLSQTIVKVKADVKQSYYSVARIDTIESYLKEHAWHSRGVDINVIVSDEVKDDVNQITVADSPDEALKKFIEQNPDRFENVEEVALAAGISILKAVKGETNG
jgi:exonuclease SbcD